MTQHHKLYFHKLGTPQQEDKLIFGGSETPRRYISGYLAEDNRFLVITAANSTTGNELYIQDLSQPGSKIVKVVDNFDNNHDVIDNEGSKLYIFTNLNAPNNRIVTVDAENPGVSNWNDFIPQTENVLHVAAGGGKIFANYLKDAGSMVMQYDLQGKLEKTIELPGHGTASGFSGKKEDTEVYYTFTS